MCIARERERERVCVLRGRERENVCIVCVRETVCVYYEGGRRECV